jgi:hypothetical protein
MARLTADLVSPVARAAPVKLSASTTAAKIA